MGNTAPGAAPGNLTENQLASPIGSRQSGCYSSRAFPQGHAAPAKPIPSFLAEWLMLAQKAELSKLQCLQAGHSQQPHKPDYHKDRTVRIPDRLHRMGLVLELEPALEGKAVECSLVHYNIHKGWVLQVEGSCCSHHSVLLVVVDTGKVCIVEDIHCVVVHVDLVEDHTYNVPFD